ncbi:hypothetical protein [Actinosynnema sp. NPDC023587]|uniref:hypothetical protein n=1 Tax=Actinosynnema sp. NPDC023587 TaxID=3154695 RepID=UPI0033C513C9
MITKAPAKGKYGKDTYGLLRYLFGPGKSNEHTNPHLVAAWDPEWLEGGAFAERHRGWLARLAREVDAPMTGHAVDLDGGHVYHVVLSVPRQDGQLGDARWRELVEEAIDRMGFGPSEGGRAGCRWVAVHHGSSKEGTITCTSRSTCFAAMAQSPTRIVTGRAGASGVWTSNSASTSLEPRLPAGLR